MVALNFRWTPGVGPDHQALARMASHARRPQLPMGEAWFMGDQREMYAYLAEQELDVLDHSQLAIPLAEIAGGTASFGPMAEWQSWFNYLLPRLVPIAMQAYKAEIHELLITAFITQHPAGVSEPPYRGFREDTLHTLGQIIMDGSKWNEGQISLGRVLVHPPSDLHSSWGWWEASGDLSASLFFCLKYLMADEIEGWVRSVLIIPDPHWRAQIMLWIMGSQLLLDEKPEQPSNLEGKEPGVEWELSHCLTGNYTGRFEQPIALIPFIPSANKLAFRAALHKYLTDSELLEWRKSVETIDYLALEALPIAEGIESVINTAL